MAEGEESCHKARTARPREQREKRQFWVSPAPMTDAPYLLFLNSYYISLDSPLKVLPLLSSDVRNSLYRGFVIKYSIILDRQIQRREH
jgi:hypothetical protein